MASLLMGGQPSSSAGNAYYFQSGKLELYQSLLVKTQSGRSDLPLTRADWYRPLDALAQHTRNRLSREYHVFPPRLLGDYRERSAQDLLIAPVSTDFPLCWLRASAGDQ